ncbi:MAG TPA: MFS transporter [Gaiellaceae bacterium]|nr:MFS transporter [Gaiellaceae bacterium]
MRKRLPSPLQQRDFSLFWVAILATGFAAQMMAVAIGWQVYAIDENALHLGLVGLAEFLPLPLLALPAGHVADRLPRRLVFAVAIVLDGLIAGGLLVVTLAGAGSLWPFLLLALAAGCAASLGWPAARSMPPTLVSADLLASAMALRGIAFQTATIVGPAIGGLLFAVQAELVYAVGVGLFGAALVCVLLVTERTQERLPEATSREALFAGARFVRRTPVLFGAITLDLFAVLFGGAIALLPLFAKSILDVGPVGLGILRSSPAIGALAAGFILALRPIRGNAGRTLFVVVAIFGAAHVVFGLSKSFPLSCAALAVAGFADMFSMNIRSMTVALATPDALRGRVNAVEMVFISGSNELGAFESGVAAALIGAVPAVMLGGVATICIAVVWARLFPDLRRVDRLELLRPASDP